MYPSTLLVLQVKYERAGNRANKLLKPVGLSLPEAKGSGLLLERGSDPVEPQLLETSSADDASTPTLPALAAGSGIIDIMPEAGVSPTTRSSPLKEVVPQEDPTEQAPESFDVFDFFRQFGNPEGAGAEVKADGARSKVEPKLAATLTPISTSELTTFLAAVDSEKFTQESSLRAANVVLHSSEPVIAGLEETSKRDVLLLQQLKTVASNVQQMYVLAEMAEAVETAEVRLSRLQELSAKVVDLAAELRTYATTAKVRCGKCVFYGISRHKLAQVCGTSFASLYVQRQTGRDGHALMSIRCDNRRYFVFGEAGEAHITRAPSWA